MILASVAKLNQYVGDPIFDRIIDELTTIQQEGQTAFELDLKNLAMSEVFDISRALSDLGYIVDYNEDTEILEAQYDE